MRRGQGGNDKAREDTPKSHVAFRVWWYTSKKEAHDCQSPAPSWSWPCSGDGDKQIPLLEKALNGIYRARPPAKVETMTWVLPHLHFPERSLLALCGCPGNSDQLAAPMSSTAWSPFTPTAIPLFGHQLRHIIPGKLLAQRLTNTS